MLRCTEKKLNRCYLRPSTRGCEHYDNLRRTVQGRWPRGSNCTDMWLLQNLVWYRPNMIKNSNAISKGNESVQCVQEYIRCNVDMSIKRTGGGAGIGS